MGKYKGKNNQERKQSIPSDSKPPVHRDSFFLKSKTTKGTKSFESREVHKNDSLNEEHRNSDVKEGKTKKPFDKKQWRIKKYSNKFKVEQWKEVRSKRILNDYHRSTKKNDVKEVDVQKIYEQYDNDEYDHLNSQSTINSSVTPPKNDETNEKDIPKKSSVKLQRKNSTIQEKITQMKEEKLKKKEEFLKKKAEREEALKLSRQKKAERYRRLNKRTKKGQPIMKDRMEMLYEQIQKICQE